MFNSLFNFKTLSIIIFLIVFLTSFLACASYSNNAEIIIDEAFVSDYGFYWPIPGYSRISSYFGKRTSPTTGASTYHSGLDIPAPEGTPLVAIGYGQVTFASWGAGGGYTITIQLLNQSNFKTSYCHVSPVMYVSVGDIVTAGQVVGTVGPKNVYGIKNNPYKDKDGNPTNGPTTGPHLHFTLKCDGTAVNPLNYYTANAEKEWQTVFIRLPPQHLT